MNFAKTVGVVIPIYNVEKYLKECLDSVINQTYTNLEIILVNDGSTDENSLSIAKEYTLKDKRITLFDKKNGGQSTARNVGIEYFSGEYKLKNKTQTLKENSLIEFNLEDNNPYEIYTVYKSYKAFNNEQDLINFTYPHIDYIIFLDSDDYWELNCIEECVPRMDGVEVVWFDYKSIYEQGFLGKRTDWTWFLSYNKNSNPNKESVIKWLQEYDKENHFAFVWSGMIDFNYLKTIQLKFIDKIFHQDFHFGFLLFSQSKFIYTLPSKLVNYRIREGSTTIRKFENQNTSSLPDYLVYLSAYFKQENEIKRYYSVYSWSRMIDFAIAYNYKHMNKFLNSITNKILKIDFNKSVDPLNLNIYIQFALQYQILYQYLNPKNWQTQYGTAKTRIQNQLSYKLGQAMIINSKNIFGILLMPVYIISILLSHKQEQKIYQEKIKKDPSLKLPPLEEYPDYKEAIRLKNHFSYKLGEALIKASKTWYKGGLFKLPFDILREWKSR
ncbi:glycosyltransferase family 2 protein [Campylobacter coli]|nr:glycosyltransferase family 2 protein [Campylobacter coli]EGP7860570.1 glycosyltransferase family 2 protein [Campylobacter jejuni]